MGLKKGDKLVIRRVARIQLSQYDSITPQVILSRDIGDDPEADRLDLERIAYVELRRAVVEEVLTRRGFDKIMGDKGNLTRLLKHCEKAVRRGYDKARSGLSFPSGSREIETIDIESTTESGRKKRKRERS